MGPRALLPSQVESHGLARVIPAVEAPAPRDDKRVSSRCIEKRASRVAPVAARC